MAWGPTDVQKLLSCQQWFPAIDLSNYSLLKVTSCAGRKQPCNWKRHIWGLLLHTPCLTGDISGSCCRPVYQWAPACLSFPLLPSPPYLHSCLHRVLVASGSQKGELGAHAGAGLCPPAQLKLNIMLRDTDIQRKSGEERLVYFFTFIRAIKCLAFVCAGLLLLSCQNWLLCHWGCKYLMENVLLHALICFIQRQFHWFLHRIFSQEFCEHQWMVAKSEWDLEWRQW